MAKGSAVQTAEKPAEQQTQLIEYDSSAQMPAYMSQDTNRGSENVSVEDIAIPRLEIVQSLSPIRKEDPDALEGMLYNSVTHELYGHEVAFVPVMFIRQFLVWKDRKKGGGFRGAFPDYRSANNRIAETADEGENPADFMAIETPSHYGLLVVHPQSVENRRLEEVAISMPRSKMKVSKRFNALVQLAGGDRFSKMYSISTIEETNAVNQEYFNFNVTPMAWCPEAIYRRAEQIFEKIKGAMININHASADSADDADLAGSMEY